MVAREDRFLHPGRAAELLRGGEKIGYIGESHPDLNDQFGVPPFMAFELDFEKLLQYSPRQIRASSLPRYPAVERDFALVVDQAVPSQQIIDCINELGQSLIERVEVFDEYRGDSIPQGKKSLAYKISYRADDRTLTDSEVNTVHQQVVDHVGKLFRSAKAKLNRTVIARKGMAAMTKAEIITRIYEKVGFSKKDATDVVEATFDIIKGCLEQGEKVKISGFGNFVVNTKRPRKGRNPQTGDEIIIVGRKVLTFKASQILKKSLNGMSSPARNLHPPKLNSMGDDHIIAGQNLFQDRRGQRDCRCRALCLALLGNRI